MDKNTIWAIVLSAIVIIASMFIQNAYILPKQQAKAQAAEEQQRLEQAEKEEAAVAASETISTSLEQLDVDGENAVQEERVRVAVVPSDLNRRRARAGRHGRTLAHLAGVVDERAVDNGEKPVVGLQRRRLVERMAGAGVAFRLAHDRVALEERVADGTLDRVVERVDRAEEKRRRILL